MILLILVAACCITVRLSRPGCCYKNGHGAENTSGVIGSEVSLECNRGELVLYGIDYFSW